MSYILDALKKATSEREHQHGGVPDLNARPARNQGATNDAHDANRPPWGLLAAGLAVVALSALAWQQLSARPAAVAQPMQPPGLEKAGSPLVALASPTQQTQQSPQSAPQTPPAAASAQTTPAVPTVPVTPLTPIGPTGPTGTLATPVAAPTVVASAAPGTEPQPPAIPGISMTPPVMPPPLPSPAAVNKPEPAPRAAAKPSTAAPGKPSSAASTGLVPGPELAPKLPPLPGSAPKLVVSGSTFSDNPAYRMLIINGQVYREGDTVGSDVRLDQIRRGIAVLSYQGQQFSLGY